ncbi:MAG TPA: N-acetylmuramoyl-L-alanine amidase [Xanthobacteraceae bacterium]|jgi:N-acetylmuramoyl-L-alanine amidase
MIRLRGTATCGLAPLLLAAGTIAASAQAPGKTAAPACNQAGFRVIVDVGHTAGTPGAVSARGVSEYEFNLRLAREVEQSLIGAGFPRTVLLISTERPRMGLFKRAARANSLSADLFLSIHHDSVPDRFLESWEHDGARLHFSDRFKGHSIFVSNENADFRGSVLFARLLGKEMKARGLQYTPHYTEKFMGHRQRILVDAETGVYRYDQLIVLRTTQMPAVLLEAGLIINRDEELELSSPARQALIAAAVTDAVKAFCAVRTPHALPTAAAQPARLTGHP